MPLQIAPMACSRMPKWMLRPAQSPQFTSPEPVITVWVEGSTSAEPPTSSGSFAPKASSALPPETRVATREPDAKLGRASRHPFGSRPANTRSNSAAWSGWSTW